MKLSGKAKLSYALGAVGKDMVYMLSASYVLYYFQDLLGVSAIAMGVILMVARVFDAFNDPIMGVIVAKTRTRWGKFRPWLLIGTVTNAVVLYLMFAAPPTMDAKGLVAYAAVTYILWGVTYTMMDIPYWSMIPAFTEGGKERENLTTLARTSAGVGSAIITIVTMALVPMLGGLFGGQGAKGVEIVGFRYFALLVAVLFVLFTVLTCVNVKEKSTAEMKTVSVGQMFKALLQNDQAMTVTIAIVLINCSIYITSNLVIYFFKYDFGTTGWNSAYVLFNTFGGGIQVLSMMALYPLLRKKFSSLQIFYICLGMAIAGYAVLLALAFTNMSVVYLLFIPGFFIFAANGMLTVITTVFLANTVDYGELKNGRRDESVIFSMQTFVVKLASGVAALVASICLSINKLQSGTEVSEADKLVDWSVGVSAASKAGLRMTMTVIPIIGLFVALFWFRKRFLLNEQKMEDINRALESRAAAE
ncbi:MAG: sugar:sodium symporter [Ruminococcaceae bacterium]|jgi:melibiose permease|nr:sugar:sodium symporter [Oscillospiraceae bacterium]